MSKHWKRTLTLLGVVAATGLVCAAVALGGKRPPTPPPPPPEPTVRCTITFLGTLRGDTFSRPHDINNWGEVVGRSWWGADDAGNAFVYNPVEGMVDLNELIDADSGWYLVSASGINDAGQIVGYGLFAGRERAYRFTPGYTDEDGYHPPFVENLGTLGGQRSWGFAINDHGEVAGHAENADGKARAFVYTDADGDGVEEMVEIGGGKYADPSAINNCGQVTGLCFFSGDSMLNAHAFRYTPGVGGLPGVMEDLGPLPENTGSGNDINDRGHVVGHVRTGTVKGWSVGHAFLYTDHLIDLGTLGGYNSGASGINSGGEVVGYSADATTRQPPTQPLHGFLYTNKTDTGGFVMVKLQNLIVNLPVGFQGWIRPEKINDSGQICGCVEDASQAFLLTPVTP